MNMMRERSPDTDFTDFADEQASASVLRRPKHKRSAVLMETETDDSVRTLFSSVIERAVLRMTVRSMGYPD